MDQLKCASLSSVSTIAPPHATDGFKTDSAPFLPHSFFLLVRPVHEDVIVHTSLSRLCFLIWPPVAVNILYFLVHAIHGLGGGYRRNTLSHTHYWYEVDVECTGVHVDDLLVSCDETVCEEQLGVLNGQFSIQTPEELEWYLGCAVKCDWE